MASEVVAQKGHKKTFMSACRPRVKSEQAARRGYRTQIRNHTGVNTEVSSSPGQCNLLRDGTCRSGFVSSLRMYIVGT